MKWLFWCMACIMSLGMQAPGAPLSDQVAAVFDRYVELPQELLPVLESVQDKASADEAAPRLMNLLQKVYDSRKELNAIPSLTEDQAAQVRRLYEKSMRERWGKVYEQLFRLQRVRCYDSMPMLKQFSTLCALLEK